MEVHLEGPLRPTERVIGSHRKIAGCWGSRDYRQQRIVANSLLPILACLVTIKRLLRRADREAEGARLLSEYAPKGHLGFESPALRQFNFKEGSHLGSFFIIKRGGWGFEPERARALSKRKSVCSPWAKSRKALKPEGMRSISGHPQLSASKTLKKGSIWGPFLLSRKASGDSNPKKEASFRTPPFSEHIVSLAPIPRAPWPRFRFRP